MTPRSKPRRRDQPPKVARQLLRGLFACASLTFTALACSKDPQPPAEAKAPASMPESAKVEPPPAEEPQVPAPEAPAESFPAKVSEDSFDLELTAAGEHQVGKESIAEVVLVAKAPFKVNDEYPYSFSAVKSESVAYARMKIGKDKVKLEKMRATLPVAFTPKAAGSQAIEGTFKFSVCTEEQCLIKKHQLALKVDVK